MESLLTVCIEFPDNSFNQSGFRRHVSFPYSWHCDNIIIAAINFESFEF